MLFNNAITGTNPYCRTLTDPRGGIILNKYYNMNKYYNILSFMTGYAITDTKKGRTGIAPTYLQTTPKTKINWGEFKMKVELFP